MSDELSVMDDGITTAALSKVNPDFSSLVTAHYHVPSKSSGIGTN